MSQNPGDTGWTGAQMPSDEARIEAETGAPTGVEDMPVGAEERRGRMGRITGRIGAAGRQAGGIGRQAAGAAQRVTTAVRLPETARTRIPALTVGNGVPLHAALTDVPVALYTLAPVFDLIAYRRGSKWLGNVGRMNMAVAVAWSTPTAVAGLLDYLRAPAGSGIKGIGIVHAVLNTTVLGLGSTSLVLRGFRRRPTMLSVPFSLSAAALVTISSHLGGIMVYREGMRVKPAEVCAAEHPETMAASTETTRQAA